MFQETILNLLQLPDPITPFLLCIYGISGPVQPGAGCRGATGKPQHYVGVFGSRAPGCADPKIPTGGVGVFGSHLAPATYIYIYIHFFFDLFIYTEERERERERMMKKERG